MSRVLRGVISVVVMVALVATLCTVRPAPAYAVDDDVVTIAIILGSVIGGLMILALIFTFFVRNNPAWMPAVPDIEQMVRRDPWDRPNDRLRFGFGCGVRDGTVPLVCW